MIAPPSHGVCSRSLTSVVRRVDDFAPLEAGTCSEYANPDTLSFAVGMDAVAHASQRLTFSQVDVSARLTQILTFTHIDCPPSSDCIGSTGGEANTVRLSHGGASSDKLNLESATATEIAAAFNTKLSDATYSHATATVVSRTDASVVWRLALRTPWASCASQLSLPLVGAVVQAKVNVTTHVESGGSCLSGGVDLALGQATAPTAYVAWDATEVAVATAINSLLGDRGSVTVTRTGDGHTSASFSIAFLGVGHQPMLRLASTSQLLQRTFGAMVSDSVRDEASGAIATLNETVAGGIDLTPIPGCVLATIHGFRGVEEGWRRGGGAVSRGGGGVE